MNVCLKVGIHENGKPGGIAGRSNNDLCSVVSEHEGGLKILHLKNLLLLIIFLIGTFGFSQENSNSTMEKPVEFMMVQNPPVYIGCEQYKSSSSQSKCSNKKIMEHIDQNFNNSVAENTELVSGNYEVTVIFIVDKQGEITNISTKGSDYSPFIKEAIRLINLIPKYSSPGNHRAKVVNVRYTIPIVFTVDRK